MTIIVFASGKGGVGKTTHACQQGRERAAAGRDVLMVDGDTQQSLSLWAAIRYKAGVQPVLPCVSIFDDMAAQIKLQAPKYDDIIIDTRGTQESNPVMYEALTVADTMITPIRTSLFDKATMKEMDRIVGLARAMNPKLKAYIMFNGVSPNPRNTRDSQVRETLKGLKHYNGVLAGRACHRQIYEDLAAMGMSSTEWGGDKKARQETITLAAEIWQ